MALTYDLTAIDNWHDLDPALTEAMTYATLAVGIGEITDASAAKFHGRLRAYEKVVGTITCNGDGTDRATTPADVRAFVGLKTNVLTETDAKFARKLLAWAYNEATREWTK